METRDWSYPVTVEGDVTSVKRQRSNNLSEEGKRGRDTVKAEYREVLSREMSLGGDENAPFTIGQLRMA